MFPIGVFDSGYGGLTVLKSIRSLLPEYDYIYLGDNARAPYGTKDFDTVLQYTLEAVKNLLDLGCPLIILACNTASAKALRNIQQNYIANVCPDKRVLGVIRPTAEIVGGLTKTGHIAVLATPGTVKSGSYEMEIRKFCRDGVITSMACPTWVPIVESGKWDSEEADADVKDRMERLFEMDGDIDTIILGCTHYPFLINKIRKYCGEGVKIVSQGEYVARSLKDYLRRHKDMDERLSKGGSVEYITTGNREMFDDVVVKWLGG